MNHTYASTIDKINTLHEEIFTIKENTPGGQELLKEILVKLNKLNNKLLNLLQKDILDKEKNAHIFCIEKYTIRSAIEKVKNDAATNIILLRHMENLTTEQKLYLAYFWGTREGKATILDLE